MNAVVRFTFMDNEEVLGNGRKVCFQLRYFKAPINASEEMRGSLKDLCEFRHLNE